MKTDVRWVILAGLVWVGMVRGEEHVVVIRVEVPAAGVKAGEQAVLVNEASTEMKKLPAVLEAAKKVDPAAKARIVMGKEVTYASLSSVLIGCAIADVVDCELVGATGKVAFSMPRFDKSAPAPQINIFLELKNTAGKTTVSGIGKEVELGPGLLDRLTLMHQEMPLVQQDLTEKHGIKDNGAGEMVIVAPEGGVPVTDVIEVCKTVVDAGFTIYGMAPAEVVKPKVATTEPEGGGGH